MIYEPMKGVSFYDAVRELKEQLRKSRTAYRQMLFNGIYVTVSVDSNPDDIAVIYNLKKELGRLKGE